MVLLVAVMVFALVWLADSFKPSVNEDRSPRRDAPPTLLDDATVVLDEFWTLVLATAVVVLAEVDKAGGSSNGG